MNCEFCIGDKVTPKFVNPKLSINKVYRVNDIKGNVVKIEDKWFLSSDITKIDDEDKYRLTREAMTLLKFRLDMEEFGYSVKEYSTIDNIELKLVKNK